MGEHSFELGACVRFYTEDCDGFDYLGWVFEVGLVEELCHLLSGLDQIWQQLLVSCDVALYFLVI